MKYTLGTYFMLNSLTITQSYNLRAFGPYEMEFVKNFTSGDNNQEQGQGQNKQRQQEQVSNQQGGGGFLGGLGDKLNSAAGGGRESEKDEDVLDKGNSISLDVIAF